MNKLKDRLDLNRKNRSQYMRDWRNEHGQPDLQFLQALATEGSPRSIEKLKSIAQDLDIDNSPGDSNQELIDKILADIRSDPIVTT